MTTALLAFLIIFSPSPDPRVIGYQCEAWHVSTYAGTPWRLQPCDPNAPMQITGDWTAEIPDEPAGWFVVFCIRARTCCDVSDCQLEVTR